MKKHDMSNTPQLFWEKEIDSTSNQLRRLSMQSKLPEGSLVVADFQTAGRGQVGNTWESENEKNLLFSLLLYPDFIPANRQFLISQIASLSVKETLDAYIDSVQVKWPNDIYWKDRKICGMLIENDLSGQLLYCSIIGVGLNVNQETFRGDAPNPVSLYQITGETYDRKELLMRFLRTFFNYYSLLCQGREQEVRAAYMQALYHGKGYHRYADEQGTFEACIQAIEPTGHLILALRSGEQRRYAFKEVRTLVDE